MRACRVGIQGQKDALGRTLFAMALKHNKAYVWATMKTIRLFMEKYQHVNVSPRTLTRRIGEMEKEGYIVRQLRTMPDGNGGKRFTSSLTFLKNKLFLWVEKMERFARKVFSFFRKPSLAYYSLKPYRRDLGISPPTVEILWKTEEKGRASPIRGVL